MTAINQHLTDNELDAETDEMIRSFLNRMFNTRVLCIVGIYAAALLLTGVGVGKAVVFCAVVWFLITLPLGRRYIEMIAGVWLFAAMVAWLDIPAVNRLIDVAGLKLAALL